MPDSQIPKSKIPACAKALAGRQIPNFWRLWFGHWKLKKGFSLIELLVVIALFSITAAVIVAAYNNFNQNQRLKNAALALRDDIRSVQNKALSGDKSTSNCTPAGRTLIGWYLTLSASSTSYSINVDCKQSNIEYHLSVKTIQLPPGISIGDIDCGSQYGFFPPSENYVRILFEPLLVNAHFYGPPPQLPTPDRFYKLNYDNRDDSVLECVGSEKMLIKVLLTNSSGASYEVIVSEVGGKVYENKI